MSSILPSRATLATYGKAMAERAQDGASNVAKSLGIRARAVTSKVQAISTALLSSARPAVSTVVNKAAKLLHLDNKSSQQSLDAAACARTITGNDLKKTEPSKPAEITTANVSTKIIEIEHIDQLREYFGDQNTLYLFDIDDTMIDNPTYLGIPRWRNWAKPLLAKLQAPYALFDALTLYMAQHAPYKKVEETTGTLISDLQKKGLAVFGFTARGRSQWYTTDIDGVDRFTHKQLKQAGIDFSRSQVPEPLKNLEAKYFYDGIIFAEHIQKGDLLKHLLKDLDYTPSRIIFVDDKLEQVKSVEAIVAEAGIAFTGFWYRHSEKFRTFDPMAAAIQLEAMLINQELMDDKAAQQLAEMKQDKDAQAYFKETINKIDLERLTPNIEFPPLISP